MNKANLLATAAALLVSGAAMASSAGPTVTAGGTTFTGVATAGVNSYLGIPYAAPPVGALRWVRPQPHAALGASYSATALSNYCPQGLSEVGPGGGAEDCLYLNVQVPAGATASSNLPVMFWIHGGGLTTGEGGEYDGSSFVTEGNVIYVSFNYRLGALGFLAHPAFAATDANGSSGNYGLMDQQAALTWVKANIAAFGGNPNRVLVFGESAGGQSTIDALVSPTMPAFNAAVIESGAYARSLPTLAQAEATGISIAQGLGCTDNGADCATLLRGLPASAIVALSSTTGTTNGGSYSATPNIDGDVLTVQPFTAFASGNFRHVPIISGGNHDEYRLFVSEQELLGGAPYTATQYDALAAGLLGGDTGALVLAEYPLSAFPSPNYAVATVATDEAFSCGSLLVDSLVSKYTPTYAYELNDPNPPNVFLPHDPNLPSLRDAHATELPYLYPTFQNHLIDLGAAKFSQPQLQLTKGMRASWYNLIKYGRPLNPTGGTWSAYSTAQHNILQLVPPSPYIGTGFFADHKCGFWLPYLLQQANLPSNTPY
jgi:para-nitrobenzyl esterase